MLQQDSNGSIHVLDEHGFLIYTVETNESGLIKKLVNELLKYEKFFKTNELERVLSSYFNVPNDTYAYNLTRVKSAFEIGTMGLDDFEEFDEDTINDLAETIRGEIE